jgi:DNA-binding response OmpR family regulator
MTLGEAIIGIRHFTSVPLLVTGRPGDVKEVVTALESGSDAYVRLPCNLTELMVRIRGLLRRTGGRLICPNEAPLASGPLTINPSTYEVFLEDHPISLTPSEFKLLYLLVSHRGAIVTGSAMEYSLWGDQVARSGSAKKYIRSLRRKLGANPTEPMWIANVPRVGYRFLGPGSVPATAMGLAA